MQHDCCGFDFEDGYKNYFKKGEDVDDSKIPNSCCGKYDVDSVFRSGAKGLCKFEEYSTRKGCGDLLTEDVLDKMIPLTLQNIALVVLVISYLIQAAAAAGSFYIFYASKDQNSGKQAI